MLARRTLKNDPAAYGLSESALSDQTFSRDTKEREQALLTVVTQSYRNLWFPGQGGKILRREISTAGGEGGRSVIEGIREVLLNDGELVTAELAASTTASASAAKLFFGAQDYQTLESLRDGFACRRDWPVLEDPSVFDILIRSGVRHGAWCLFRIGEAESEKPAEFYARETDEIPFSVVLTEKGWSLVTPQGAKKRNWTLSDKPDPAQIRKWVLEEVNKEDYCSVAEVAYKVEQDHGSVSTQEIGKAVDDLVKAGHFYVHSGDMTPDVDPNALRGAADWVMETVSPEYKVVTKPEAGKRGWVVAQPAGVQLSGEEARQKVLPMLKSLAQIYKTGGKSTIDYLAHEVASQNAMEKGMGLPLRPPWWRKPKRTAVADYAKEWERCIRHNVIDPAFLQAVEIPYWELEYWCRENHVPMPGFWVRSRPIGGKQLPLPGARPFEAENEEGEAPGGELEETPADDGPSAHQRAAYRRHKPVNDLKRDCVRFAREHPGPSDAETVRRFLDQLPEERRRLLALTNAERTLTQALSEWKRKPDAQWLKGFDPSADPQT